MSKKKRANFPTEKWAKYCWTANIWYHLSLNWTEGKKEDYTRGNNPEFNRGKKKKKMTQFISSVIKHPPLSNSNTANWQFTFLEFCISLSSKETLKAKMLGFYFPRMMPNKAVLTLLTLQQATLQRCHWWMCIKFKWRKWVVVLFFFFFQESKEGKNVLSMSMCMITRKFEQIKSTCVGCTDVADNNSHVNQ